MRKVKIFAFLILIACSITFGYYGGRGNLFNNSLIGTMTYQSNSSVSATTVESNKISVYFPRAGQDAEKSLISEMNAADKTLDVAIYSFTDTKVADTIVAAQKRGVTVRLISDRECSGNSFQNKALSTVKKAGVPIKVNTHSGIMHLKDSIIDGSVVTTGSFNYTKAAQNDNDENFVVINNFQIAQTYKTEFNKMWNDTSSFESW